jgi:hypothetical protein
LIDVINERFGTDFTDADQLFFDQIIEAAIADGSLQEAAAVNPEDKFALLFSSQAAETLFIERMEQNEDIFARFMNERDLRWVTIKPSNTTSSSSGAAQTLNWRKSSDSKPRTWTSPLSWGCVSTHP